MCHHDRCTGFQCGCVLTSHPAPTSCGPVVPSDRITGVPHACDSTAARPNPSPSDVLLITSMAPYQVAISAAVYPPARWVYWSHHDTAPAMPRSSATSARLFDPRPDRSAIVCRNSRELRCFPWNLENATICSTIPLRIRSMLDELIPMAN